MTKAVALIHIVVVVFPIACAGVVRRVYVNHVHLALVAIKQKLEGVEIVGVDEQMPRFVRPAAFNTLHRHKRRINRVAKTAHHHEVSNGKFFARQFGRWITPHRTVANGNVLVDAFDAPKLVAGFAFERNQFAQLHRQIAAAAPFPAGVPRKRDQTSSFSSTPSPRRRFLCGAARRGFAQSGLQFSPCRQSRIRSRANQPCLQTVFVGTLVPEIKMGRTYLRPYTGT